MSDKLNVSYVLSNVLEYSEANPREYTYIGIGSAPYLPLDKLDEKTDQILPKFLIEYIQSTDETIRVIHIDPEFNRHLEKMKDYFKVGKWSEKIMMDFEYDNSDEMHIWRTNDHRIEVIIIQEAVHHPNKWSKEDNEWFFQKYVNLTLKYNHKLVVQEYTGHELNDLRKKLYEECLNKEAFKKKILIDITYGNDCHCGTNLSKYKPFYDEYLDFYNMTLLTKQEMVNIIGKNQEIDEIIKVFFIKKFRNLVNYIHVDYRRKTKGDTIMYGHDGYNNQSSPDEIMHILQQELNQIFSVFEMLNLMSSEKKNLIQNLFEKYKEYDMYQWNQQILSIA
jgi:hypothetical protein